MAGVLLPPLGGGTTLSYSTAPAISWSTDFESARAMARLQGMPMIVKFDSPSCAACKKLDKETFSAPSVVAEAKRFVAVKQTVDGPGPAEDLADKVGVQGYPTVVFYSRRGDLLPSPRFGGFVSEEEMLAAMKAVESLPAISN